MNATLDITTGSIAETVRDADDYAHLTTPPETVPGLLEGVIGASASTIEAVATLEALTLDASRKGCAHTAAEVAGDPRLEEIDLTWQSASKAECAAALALLDAPPADAADAVARLTAYLRSKALYATQTRNWRQFSPKEAVDHIIETMPSAEEDIAPAFLYALKYLAAQAPSGPAAGSAAVLQAEAAYVAAHAGHNDAVTAFGLVEARQMAGDIGEDHPDFIAASACVDEASTLEDEAWTAFMATPAITPADLAIKARRYGECVVVRMDPEVGSVSFAHIQADIDRLAGSVASWPAASSTSASQFAFWAAENIRLTDLSAEQTDEAARDRLCDEAIAFDLKIRNAPCDGPAAAVAKLQWVAEAFEAGETGDEKRVLSQVIAYLGHPTSGGTEAGPQGADAALWAGSRQAYIAAKQAWDDCDDRKDEDDGDPLFNAYCDALEVFQATPPPSVLGMVEQMRAEFAFGGAGVGYTYQGPDCPHTMRDLLDSGDSSEIFVARFYMHALRLAGICSKALDTPIVAGMYPGYDFSEDHGSAEANRAAWTRHHETREARPHHTLLASRVILGSVDGAISGPDAELLSLGAEFERRWEAQRGYPIADGDDGYEELDGATHEIAERIRHVRPTTLEGYRVKARVVQYCQSDNPSDPVELISGDDLNDSNVAASIVNDLLGVTVRNADERNVERDHENQLLGRLRGMRSYVEVQPGDELAHPDAELLALLPRWLELERKLTLLVGYTVGASLGFTDAMKAADERWTAERDAILDLSRKLRANTAAGVRVKAILAMDWLPTSDFEGWDDQVMKLLRSLIADILDMPEVDMSARALDAWRHANGVAHHMEDAKADEAAYDALVQEIEADARGPKALQLARAL